MITIAWYNIVAIIAGIAFIYWRHRWRKADSISRSVFYWYWSFFVVLFYAIWGGIFWW